MFERVFADNGSMRCSLVFLFHFYVDIFSITSKREKSNYHRHTKKLKKDTKKTQ